MYDDSIPETNGVPDNWEPGGLVPLDGILERNTFPPFITAAVMLVLCLVAFNIVGLIVGVVAIAIGGDAEAMIASLESPEGLQALVEEHMADLLIGNTIGQFLCIGLAAWVLTRMSTSKPAAFLRFRRCDIRLVLISLVGLIAFQPVVSFIGELWSALPWPASWRAFEAQLMEPISAVLEQPGQLLPNLFMIAVTPAICEELLFRGYFQRHTERVFSPAVSIAIVGLVFGAYHLQPTKLLPLACLGAYFSYIVWKSGSLWPAIAAHFLNNGLAISIGTYFAQRPDFDVAELENMSFAWYYVVLGIISFVASIILFNRIVDQVRRPQANQDPNPG